MISQAFISFIHFLGSIYKRISGPLLSVDYFIKLIKSYSCSLFHYYFNYFLCHSVILISWKLLFSINGSFISCFSAIVNLKIIVNIQRDKSKKKVQKRLLLKWTNTTKSKIKLNLLEKKVKANKLKRLETIVTYRLKILQTYLGIG